MKKIIIFDHSVSEVHIFEYNEEVWDDVVDFYDSVNDMFGTTFKDSQCSYMICDTINLTIH